MTERLIGATWCSTDGFLYPPVIYGEGIRRASELGARIMQHTDVVGSRQERGRIVELHTSSGPVPADWVVVSVRTRGQTGCTSFQRG